MGKKKNTVVLDKLEDLQLNLAIQLQNLDERIRRIEDDVLSCHNTITHQEILSTVVDLAKQNLQPEGNVLNLYEWGSRWFGTAHKSSSDYDFLAIVTGYDQPEHINVVETENIDVALHEVNHFQRLLDQHVPWVIPFLSYDSSGIWLNNHKFEFKLRLPQLKKALFININVNMNQAKSFWRGGEIRKSKKRVYYVLQILTLMNQVASNGKVYDKTQANKYLHHILSTPFNSWKEFQNWFEPIQIQLQDEFKSITQAYRTFEILTNENTLHTINFIKTKGIDRISIELSIDITKHREYYNLCHLHYNSSLSAPPDSKIVSECNGLILNLEDLSIVTLPVNRIFKLKDKSAPSIDISNCRVFIRSSDDYFVFMYYYNNKWNISTCIDPQAQELVGGEMVKDIFWNIWDAMGYKLPSISDNNNSAYTFTFTVHSNRLQPFIHCDKEAIYLFGVKEAKGIEEKDPVKVAHENGWQSLKESYDTDRNIFLNQDPRYFILKDYLRSLGNIAGLLLVDSQYTRIYVDSPLLESLIEVTSTEDKQTHELVLLQTIADYPFENSTLNNFPITKINETYEHVLREFKQLIIFLDEKYYPIKRLDKVQFNIEAEKIGDLSAFLYFMKRASFPSSKQYFELDTDRKKVNKYIRVWWSLHKITTEQRKFDYCFK